MLYATNGQVQELPANTVFDYWDHQLDFGRAFKVAKIEQQRAIGVREAPLQEFLVHILLECVAADPRMAWTSRPKGQAVNWVGWGKFCRWVLLKSPYDMDRTLSDIRSGYVSSYFPQFLAFNYTSPLAQCYSTSDRIDKSVLWDYMEFKVYPKGTVNPITGKYECCSERPGEFVELEQWVTVTPEELAKYGELVAQWQDFWGDDQVKRMTSDPPTMAQHASEVSQKASPPQPLEDQELEAENGSGSSSLLVPIVGLGAVGLLLYLATRGRK